LGGLLLRTGKGKGGEGKGREGRGREEREGEGKGGEGRGGKERAMSPPLFGGSLRLWMWLLRTSVIRLDYF